LREEPQALLRKGQRQVAGARARHDAAGRRTGAWRRRLDQIGHGADGLELEDRVDADLHREAAPYARHQLHGLQRIAAVVEEAAGEIDGRVVEHIAPDPQQLELNRRGVGVDGGIVGRGGGRQREQGRAISLPFALSGNSAIGTRSDGTM
jgi:hypothetical protein